MQACRCRILLMAWIDQLLSSQGTTEMKRQDFAMLTGWTGWIARENVVHVMLLHVQCPENALKMDGIGRRRGEVAFWRDNETC